MAPFENKMAPYGDTDSAICDMALPPYGTTAIWRWRHFHRHMVPFILPFLETWHHKHVCHMAPRGAIWRKFMTDDPYGASWCHFVAPHGD